MAVRQQQQNQFSSRLGRVSSGGSRQVYGGSGYGGAAPERTFATEIVMVPLAMIFGAATVMIGRLVEFHVLSKPSVAEMIGGMADYMVWADTVIAVILALVLGKLLKLWGGSRGKALLAGFLTIWLFEGIFIVNFPDIFAKLYSLDYVASVVVRVAL